MAFIVLGVGKDHCLVISIRMDPKEWFYTKLKTITSRWPSGLRLTRVRDAYNEIVNRIWEKNNLIVIKLVNFAHLIALKELADVVLFDVAAGIAKGKALDIAQSSPVNKFNINLSGTDNYEDTKNSDVIIISAWVPRKQGMSRYDLLGIYL